MASRIEKYYNENENSEALPTRSSRNSRLYKEVYGKYGDLDNLPIEDNTDEIDMDRLKELVLNSNQKKDTKSHTNSMNIIETPKKTIDEKRLYDINKILEKAKYENNKLKEPISQTSKINKNILTTLENSDISLEDLKRDIEKFDKKEISKEDELSMTRELKYKNLTQNDNEFKKMHTNDLSLDLFTDLKPSGNTIVTKPVDDTNSSINNSINVTKENFYSSDTSDIDIIKEDKATKEENDFFTSSYEFSKNDFTGDDDYIEDEKKGGIFKIILLFLFIAVLIGVIIYFIYTYGLGA